MRFIEIVAIQQNENIAMRRYGKIDITPRSLKDTLGLTPH